MSNETNMCGNSAKLREALIKAITMLAVCEWPDGTNMEGVEELRRDIDAALDAPLRNCDRPECATSKAAQAVWRKEDGGRTGYYMWLLAPATEKEGGRDGNE